MKKLYKIFNIVLVLAIFTSCTDYLNLAPKNERALKNLEDIRSVLSGYLFDVDNTYSGSTFPVLKQFVPDQAVVMFESYADNIDF